MKFIAVIVKLMAEKEVTKTFVAMEVVRGVFGQYC